MLSLSLLSIKDDLERILLMDSLNPDYIHFDVADGKFVPPVADFIHLSNLNSKLDVHLMVSDVEEYVDEYAKLNPDYITFHVEAVSDVHTIIALIKDKGIKVGIAINTETSVDEIMPYLRDLDLILIMSTKTGYGGVPQHLLTEIFENSLAKVEKLYELRSLNHYKYMIEIDGGITADNIERCNKCDILVVGSYITLSDDYRKRFQQF